MSHHAPSENSTTQPLFCNPPLRKPRTVSKCTFCRESKRSCSYSDGFLTAKCKRCQDKGLPCSVPELAPRTQKSTEAPNTGQAFGSDFDADPCMLPTYLVEPSCTIEGTSTALELDMADFSVEPIEKEALLLLSLHTILLLAVKELMQLATALLRPYKRDRDLETTTDAIPELTRAVDGLKAIARAVNHKMLEVGTGPYFLHAQNAMAACYFHRDYAWGTDAASVATHRETVAQFQHQGYTSITYILQIGLLQQQASMSNIELDLMLSNRAAFVSDVELYIWLSDIPILSQLRTCQLFTPQELLHVPAVAKALILDPRPDCLGRSVFQILYDAGVPTSCPTRDLDYSDVLGRTALHQALQRRDISAVDTLFKLGANFGQRCLNDLSPLHILACQGHTEMVEILLASRTKYPTDTPDGIGRTPFWYAARGSHFGVMNMLGVRSDVDVDAKDIHALSPLAIAARDGRFKLIEHLLKLRRFKLNSSPSTFTMDHAHDHRPLLLASKNGHWRCVDLILANRSWAAGGREYRRTFELAEQENNKVLKNKLRALWCIKGGIAPWFHVCDTTVVLQESLYGGSFSQQAWDTMPRLPKSNVEADADDALCTQGDGRTTETSI